MNSCRTNQFDNIKTIYVCPELHFPRFPVPKNIIPVDAEGKKVTDEDTEIMNVVIPYWYWNLIIDYKIAVDETQTYYNAYKFRIQE